jgi:tRNA pseudouridine38-40 synthase
MRNIKLTVEYDGTNYAGWQCQKSKIKTVQETIEKAIQRILQDKIKIIGSGRTDAGVHAQAQIANFKTDSSIPLEKLQKALNAVLPDDIAITKVEEVGLDFHSRFSAKSKVYRYTILNRASRPALLKDRVYFLPHPLNLKLMQKEAKALLGRHNFQSFQAQDKKEKDSIRTIKNLKISRNRDFIYIDIEADGFLYNMVRNIVGALIEIGRGRFPEGSLRKILESRNRKLAGPTVPARGLSLIKVNY